MPKEKKDQIASQDTAKASSQASSQVSSQDTSDVVDTQSTVTESVDISNLEKFHKKITNEYSSDYDEITDDLVDEPGVRRFKLKIPNKNLTNIKLKKKKTAIYDNPLDYRYEFDYGVYEYEIDGFTIGVKNFDNNLRGDWGLLNHYDNAIRSALDLDDSFITIFILKGIIDTSVIETNKDIINLTGERHFLFKKGQFGITSNMDISNYIGKLFSKVNDEDIRLYYYKADNKLPPIEKIIKNSYYLINV